MNKIKSYILELDSKIDSYFNSHKKKKAVSAVFTVFFVMYMQYLIMQFSCLKDLTQSLVLPFPYLMLNLLILFTMNLFFYIFIRKWHWTLMFTTVLMFIWSVINYYTIAFHGGPAFFGELANVGAAMEVMGGYSFKIGKVVHRIIILFIFTLCICWCAKYTCKNNWIDTWYKRIGAFSFALLSVYVLSFTPLAIVSRDRMRLNWNRTIYEYGIASMLIENIDQTINYLDEPEGYELAKIESIPLYKNQKNDEIYPDILLILNETFYDINEFAPLETDIDPMENFYNIEGARFGHALVPEQAGGTNNSEYELLTSHFMTLLRTPAPFNYLDLSKSNRLPGYLKQFGYQSYGMHCFNAANYSRYRGYPQLGFDKSIFGPDDMTFTYYGNRPTVDADNYADLVEYYNEMHEGPRLLYFLTCQNHGGWELNDDSYDIVHIRNDYGDLTDDYNEYLTSIKMSSDAIHDLVDYYRDSDRPVIICMFGDHCPSFLSENKEISADTEYVNKRSTPLMIWSNMELDKDVSLDCVSVPFIVPTIMDMADIPMSTYYQKLYDLKTKVNALTKDQKTVSSDFVVSPIKDNPHYKEIMDVYYMEYNDIKGGKERRKDLFETAFYK